MEIYCRLFIIRRDQEIALCRYISFYMPIITQSTQIMTYQTKKRLKTESFCSYLCIFFFYSCLVTGLKPMTQDGGFLRNSYIRRIFFCWCSVQHKLIIVSYVVCVVQTSRMSCASSVVLYILYQIHCASFIWIFFYLIELFHISIVFIIFDLSILE